MGLTESHECLEAENFLHLEAQENLRGRGQTSGEGGVGRVPGNQRDPGKGSDSQRESPAGGDAGLPRPQWPQAASSGTVTLPWAPRSHSLAYPSCWTIVTSSNKNLGDRGLARGPAFLSQMVSRHI